MTTALFGNEKLTVSLQFNLWVRIICEGNDNKTHVILKETFKSN